MDVGDPSNFVRVLELFDKEWNGLKKMVTSYSISDQQTRDTMLKVFNEQQYLTDPHGAVAYNALEQYLRDHPSNQGIFLETAHPVKFYDTVVTVTGQQVAVPESISQLNRGQKKSIRMKPAYHLLEDFLLSVKIKPGVSDLFFCEPIA